MITFMNLKYFIKLVIPPILILSFKKVQAAVRKLPAEWEYLPGGWNDDSNQDQGWNDASIVNSQLEKWNNFVNLTRGCGPLGVAHESSKIDNQDFGSHATIMSFAYVAALAARHKDYISILDWGGGVGHYGVLSRVLLPGVPVDYHCKDLPLLCTAGRSLLEGFTFHDNTESCFSRDYDLVVASSSLQYSKDWRAVFESLSKVSKEFIYITRLPIVKTEASFVVLQRPYMHGYNTEYIGWFINRDEFIIHAKYLGLVLIREFLVSESPYVENSPERCQYSGFLFSHSPPDFKQ